MARYEVTGALSLKIALALEAIEGINSEHATAISYAIEELDDADLGELAEPLLHLEASVEARKGQIKAIDWHFTMLLLSAQLGADLSAAIIDHIVQNG